MNFSSPEITALQGIERFRAFLVSIGMPKNFEEIHANEKDIPELVRHLGVTDQDRIGGFVKLGSSDVESIYRLAL